MSLALVLATLCGRAGAAACPPESTITDRVFGGGLCLVLTAFGVETAGPAPSLVVVVHGDISAGRTTTPPRTWRRSAAPSTRCGNIFTRCERSMSATPGARRSEAC